MSWRRWLGLLLLSAVFVFGWDDVYAQTPDTKAKPAPREQGKARRALPQPVRAAQPAARPAAVRPAAKVPVRPGIQPSVRPQPAAPRPTKRPIRFRHRRYTRQVRPAASLYLKAKTCKEFLRRSRARLCVELVSMGQGNWIFTYFGHNALRVVRRGSWRSRVFNFGTFSMAKPMTLLWNYLQFKVQYQLSVSLFRRTSFHYRRSDRTLQTQRLILTPAETQALVRHLYQHYRPENRKYKYHHYTANCSTKVRDALHKVLGPDFRKYAKKQHGTSYRKHVMKAMRGNPFVMTMMDFGMGPPADRPLDWWADMFLPHHLQRYLQDPLWTKLRGRPVVTAAITHYQRRQKPPRAWSPVVIVWSIALVWLLLGVLLFGRPALRWYLRVILFVFAVLGSALLLMMLGTNFPEPPGNANILWFHPFHLVVWWMLSRRRWSRYTPETRAKIRWYFVTHAGSACLYLLLKLFSLVPFQANAHYVCFALFVFGLGAARLWQEDAWVVAPAMEPAAPAPGGAAKDAKETEESEEATTTTSSDNTGDEPSPQPA